MFRAQLSEFELVLIFYNGLSQIGCEKLKPLLEKYSILKNIRKHDLASVKGSDGREEILFIDQYCDTAFSHTNIYVGGWGMILLNAALYSVFLILLLALVSNVMDDIIFKDLLSLPIFKEHSLEIASLLGVFAFYIFVQSVDCCSKIKIRKREYTRLWDKFRYLLSFYYDAANSKILIPVIIAFFYLCGSHTWFGYGFVLYINLIIMCMLVKPLVALGYTCYQMYKQK